MANDPPFATLNHVAGDLGIPSESALLRIGINSHEISPELFSGDFLRGIIVVQVRCGWVLHKAVFYESFQNRDATISRRF
jgi:hypothetical protein